MPAWNDKMAGQQVASGPVSVNSALTALQCIPVLFSKRVSISTSFCACLGYEHHYSCKSNEISLAQRTLAISIEYIRGLHAGKWPDLMISKPDCQYTGIPLDYTGTTLADAITQWCPSGNQVIISIIGIHWTTTGATSTIECHWNNTALCW